MKHVKWWLLLAAKGLLLLLLHLLLMVAVNRWIPNATLGMHLEYTFSVVGVDLLLFVIGYFLWLDQHYRCRACLTRLRMPVATGSFGRATIFSPPQMEWICPFGHGTMRESGAPQGSPPSAVWVKHEDDFWKAFDDAWRKH